MNYEDYITPDLRENLSKTIHNAINRLPGEERGVQGPRERIRSYIMETQGKQLRPLLVVLATKLLGANEQQLTIAYENASTVELLHNMTLIHDDILDEAPLRRGKPAYHIKHGMQLALHDGDILHSYALSFVSHVPSLRIIMDIANFVGKGNGLELEYRLQNRFDFSIDDIIEVLRLKTAIVFYGAVALAGVVTDRENVTKPLEQIITNAGIAFQIQDDILDIQGEEEVFGKIHNWDVQESKRNLYLYFALQKNHREELVRIYSLPVGKKTDKDVRFVVSEFQKVKEDIINLRDQYLEKCLDELDELIEKSSEELSNFYDFLKSLIIYICTREK